MSKAPADTLNDKYLRLYGIPISVMALLLSQMPFFFPGRWDLFWKYAVIGILFTGLMWEVSRWILIRVRRRFPDLSQTRQRVAWMMLLFVVQLAVGQALITKAVMAMGLAKVSPLSFLEIWIINFAWSLFFIVVIGSTYEALYFFSQSKSAIQKAEQLKKKTAQQQLDTLKSRVNPHFLFNSLTTLSALIGDDAPRASRFVDELSKVYRYLLRAGRQTTATLGEELQFAESYAFLLENRFEGGAFSLKKSGGDFESPPDWQVVSERNIPVLTFQNALDYLVRTQNIPLLINVAIWENQVRISCAHHPKTLSFDIPDNDWQQLAGHGVRQEFCAGQLAMLVPFTSNAPAHRT